MRILRVLAWVLVAFLTLAAFVVAIRFSLANKVAPDVPRETAQLLTALLLCALLFLPWLFGHPRGSSRAARVARSVMRIVRGVAVIPVVLFFVSLVAWAYDRPAPLGARLNRVFGTYPTLLPPFFVPCSVNPEIVCRSVRVPVDPLDATLGTTRIAIAMLPARDQTTKRGTLFFHVGGPVPTLDDKGDRLSRLLEGVRSLGAERHDIVTFDPRALGWSTTDTYCPVCSGLGEERWNACNDESEEEIAANIRACFRTIPIFRTIDEGRLADDLDIVREILDVEEVSFVGISWGARMALAYATRFPHRVRALVLESPARYGRMWDMLEPRDSTTLTREQLLALGDDDIRPLAQRLRDDVGVLGFGTDPILHGALHISAYCLQNPNCPLRPRPLERILVVEDRLRREHETRVKAQLSADGFRQDLFDAVFEHKEHDRFLENTRRIENGERVQRVTKRVFDNADPRELSTTIFRRALLCRSDHSNFFNVMSAERRADVCPPITHVRDELLPFFTGRALVTEGNWDARTPPLLARAIARSIDAPLVLARGYHHGATLMSACVLGHVRALLDEGRVPDGDVVCE